MPPLPEEFEEELNELILKYRQNGLSHEDILSVFEIITMSIEEGN